MFQKTVLMSYQEVVPIYHPVERVSLINDLFWARRKSRASGLRLRVQSEASRKIICLTLLLPKDTSLPLPEHVALE